MVKSAETPCCLTNDPVVDNLVAVTSSDLVSLLSDWDGKTKGGKKAISTLTRLQKRETGFESAYQELREIITGGWRPTNSETENWLHQFAGQLPILDLFKQGGIDSLNQSLAESLARLVDEPAGKETIGEANHLLCQAIYLFPHLINSVEVKLKTGTKELADEGFGWYPQWRKLMAAKKRDITTIDMPLPYGFYAGVSGSGQRQAGMASRINVCLEQVQQEPVLMVHLKKPLTAPSIFDMTVFSLGSVESLKLLQKNNFSPQLDVTGPYHEHYLVPQADFLTYYLFFREFYRNDGYRRSQADGLWELDFANQKLTHGFVVTAGADPDQEKLHEILNYPFSSPAFNDDEIGVMVKQITVLESFPAGVICHEYKGQQIIERLAQIPVRPREF